MKPLACAIAAGALLVGAIHPAVAGHTLSQQVVGELTRAQYRERPDNPTIATQQQGTTAMLLKQRGTGACMTGWRDAVHRSAWFGSIAKCWRPLQTVSIEVCPIADGRVGKQSCIEIRKALFTLQGGARLD